MTLNTQHNGEIVIPTSEGMVIIPGIPNLNPLSADHLTGCQSPLGSFTSFRMTTVIIPTDHLPKCLSPLGFFARVSSHSLRTGRNTTKRWKSGRETLI